MSKRIAYLDYDLDNFHANTYLKLAQTELAERGFEIVSCRALQEEKGREWAKKNGIAYAESAEELAASADYIMVLAPSNPEVHLALAEEILPFGKTTYIDKTFAPDLATAEKIFAIADEYKTPVITSSALRYTGELPAFSRESVQCMQVWGGGASFGEYAIHPVEMVVSTMGAEISEIMRIGDEKFSQIDLRFTDGRLATAHVYIGINTPFSAVVTTGEETKHIPIDSPIFTNLFAGVMDFFEAGVPTIDRKESLAIRRVLDLASDPANLGKWMKM